MAADTLLQTIGRRYVLHEQLGAGGMGAVYRATDRLTGAAVALKRVTTPAEQLSFTSRGGDTDLNLSLAREFKTLSSLHHPNIIGVLDYGFDQQRYPYFTMSFLENAQTLVEAGQGRDLPAQVELLVQTLQALVYLHRRGILHRDLKPENVLVVDGQAKVLDFGVSVATSRTMEYMTQTTVGTFAYMAPELFGGAPFTRASDLYAVGLMAYEIFAGHYPYNDANMAVLLGDILYKPVDVRAIGVSDELAGVLERLLAKDREKRYDDADEVIRGLCRATGRPLPPETVEIRESYLQSARFVGREAELRRLTEALEAALAGYGSAWLIGGESGVGKSRLADELRTLALVRGALVLRGQAVSEGGGPYPLWREVARWLALAADLKPREASVLKALVADIDTLLGQKVPDAPSLDPQSTQARLFRDVVEVLRRQCQSRPVVIILEDLQWVRSNSLALLHRLSSVASGLPLLILGNYRDDERPHLPEELPGMQILKLKRLAGAAIAELSASMLGPAGREPRVVELLQRETEGNPFFLVEVVRALAERARRLEEVGHAPLPEQVFAGGVQEVIQRRLGRVPSWARPLLRLAAVAGREMDLDVLHALAPEMSLYRWLGACADVAVIEVAEERWRFAHHKLRDGVLSALPATTRQGLHRQVAETLERFFPDRIEELVERLAHHWERAGESGRALPYLAKAGQRAAERYANQEALDYFRRALAYVKAGKEYDRILAHRAQILLDLFLGQGAASDYAHLLKSATDSGNRKGELEALLGLARAHYVIALDAHNLDMAARSLELYKAAHALARELDDKACMVRALVPTMWFVDFWPEYRDEVVANAREALALSREIGDEELIIDSTIATWATGLAEWVEQGEELLHRLASRHDLPRLNQTYFRLMPSHLARGNWERCIACCDAGIHLAAEIGVPPVQYPTYKALALMHLGRYGAAWEALQGEIADEAHRFGRTFKRFGMGVYLLELMAYRRASDIFQETIEQARQLGRTWLEDWARVRRARSLIRAGSLGRANLDRIAHDLESLSGTYGPALMGDPGMIRAEIALAQGRLDEALRRAEKARDQAQENGYRPNYVSALELCLRILLRLDKPQDVVSLADVGIQMAKEMSYLPMVWRIRAAKAQAHSALGDEEAAMQEYEAAAAIIRKLVDVIPDAGLRLNVLSNTLVSSILAASSSHPRRKEE